MEIGVHDLVNMREGEGPEAAFQRTLEIVKAVDQLNYKRYWFAEHHNMADLASSSPELLVAYMAGQTQQIRLGTGGTMIMHYSPLKVAENFKTLISLAPDRIDIGLGRAAGSGHYEARALASDHAPEYENQYEKIETILKYLEDKKAAGIYGLAKAMPLGQSTQVQPWLLGSSGQSALKAAEMGLGYSFAKFFGLETDAQVFRAYRDTFQASAFFPQAKVMVSYAIIVADTDEEADYLAKPIELNLLANKQRKRFGNRSPESVRDYQFSSAEADYLQHQYAKHFYIKGSPPTVESILSQEIENLEIDEIVVYAPIYHTSDRINSFRHLAKIFNKI